MATKVNFFRLPPNLLKYTKGRGATNFIIYFAPQFLIFMYLCGHA